MAQDTPAHPAGWRRLLQRQVSLPVLTKVFSLFLARIDRPFLRFTSGRFSPSSFISGWPIVMLTTIGAKSGQVRTTPLIGIPDVEKIILVASNFGQKQFPAWWYNLRRNPQASLTYQGVTRPFKAHEATVEEYEKYWQLAIATYPGYSAYKERAGRKIPILVLEPI
jgi:deazaflavin-dependent oxidoreductase (nitroreductase family)